MQIPYALLTLTAVTGFVVSWCLNQIWRHTFGAFFQWLGGFDLHIPIPAAPDVHIKPFGFLLKFDNDAQAFFSGMVATSEHAMVRLFHQTINSFGSLAAELGALAQAVERRVAGIVGAVVPAALRAARGLIGDALRRLHGLQLAVQHLLVRIERAAAYAVTRAVALARKSLNTVASELRHLGTSALKKLTHFALRLAHVEQQLVGRRLMKLVHGALHDLKLGWLFGQSVATFLEGVLKWPYKLVHAVVRYFERLNDPFVLKEFISVERELTHLVLHELAFIVSEFKPERLEPPGPPFGPPA